MLVRKLRIIGNTLYHLKSLNALLHTTSRNVQRISDRPITPGYNSSSATAASKLYCFNQTYNNYNCTSLGDGT